MLEEKKLHEEADLKDTEWKQVADNFKREVVVLMCEHIDKLFEIEKKHTEKGLSVEDIKMIERVVNNNFKGRFSFV